MWGKRECEESRQEADSFMKTRETMEAERKGKEGTKDAKVESENRYPGRKAPAQAGLEWAALLRDAFEAPPSRRKYVFLDSIESIGYSERVRSRKSGFWKLMLQQASYIRKWVWALSSAVFLTALVGGPLLGEDIMWMLSGLMPLLAVSVVSEFVRSEIYGMTELEMAARFCLKTVLLFRMGILGALHLMTLCVASILCSGDGRTVFRTGIYLLVPYLLTDTGALWLIRRTRGREAWYACVGLAVIVGCFPVLGKYAGGQLWQSGNFSWWLAACAVLAVIAIWGWKKSMEKTEELTWN